jgi:hypothetical protein
VLLSPPRLELFWLWRLLMFAGWRGAEKPPIAFIGELKKQVRLGLVFLGEGQPTISNSAHCSWQFKSQRNKTRVQAQETIWFLAALLPAPSARADGFFFGTLVGGTGCTLPFKLMLFRLYRWFRSKSRGPPLFEPSLKVERDIAHNQNSGFVAPNS